MKIDNNKLMWIVIGAIVIIILLPYLGLVPKFAITDSDFTSDGQVPITLNSITNGTISYAYNNQTFSYPTGTVYYEVGTAIYSSIPDLAGTNTIYKYEIDSTSNGTNATLTQWHVLYTEEIKNVTVQTYIAANVTSTQLCSAVNGTYTNLTCTCPNGNIWYDNSTSKVCGPVINTVTNTVNVQPSFLQEYGVAGLIFIIMGLIIIYLIYTRTR